VARPISTDFPHPTSECATVEGRKTSPSERKRDPRESGGLGKGGPVRGRPTFGKGGPYYRRKGKRPVTEKFALAMPAVLDTYLRIKLSARGLQDLESRPRQRRNGKQKEKKKKAGWPGTTLVPKGVPPVTFLVRDEQAKRWEEANGRKPKKIRGAERDSPGLERRRMKEKSGEGPEGGDLEKLLSYADELART